MKITLKSKLRKAVLLIVSSFPVFFRWNVATFEVWNQLRGTTFTVVLGLTWDQSLESKPWMFNVTWCQRARNWGSSINSALILWPTEWWRMIYFTWHKRIILEIRYEGMWMDVCGCWGPGNRERSRLPIPLEWSKHWMLQGWIESLSSHCFWVCMIVWASYHSFSLEDGFHDYVIRGDKADDLRIFWEHRIITDYSDLFRLQLPFPLCLVNFQRQQCPALAPKQASWPGGRQLPLPLLPQTRHVESCRIMSPWHVRHKVAGGSHVSVRLRLAKATKSSSAPVQKENNYMS